jgi:hypothetical protein
MAPPFTARMPFTRVAVLVLGVLWSVDALTWGRTLPDAVAWSLVALRATIFATLAVVAVTSGRRWSAPLLAGLVATVAILGPLVVFVLSGAYAARGQGPAPVWGALFWGLVVAAPTIAFATIGALLWQRRANAGTSGAI